MNVTRFRSNVSFLLMLAATVLICAGCGSPLAAGVDWTDPVQAGGAGGLLITTVLGLLTRRKLIRTEAGVQKFMAQSSPSEAANLFAAITGQKAGGT